jgi:hypothetical protein
MRPRNGPIEISLSDSGLDREAARLLREVSPDMLRFDL